MRRRGVRLEQLLELLDGAQRERQQLSPDLVVADLQPVLAELVRAGLGRIEPRASAGGLAELRTVGGEQQRPGEGVHRRVTLAPDQIDATDDVAPLIGTTDLDLAAEVVVEPQVVVGLQQHVRELRERDPVLAVDPLAHALAGEHLVDRDVLADVAEELEQRHRLGPVAVVDEHAACRVVELDDSADLLLDRRHVVIERGVVEQVALLGPSARIADHARRTTSQGDRPVTGHLETAQHDQPDQVAGMQAVGGRVAAVVDADRTLLVARGHARPEELTVGAVVDQATRFEIGDQIHAVVDVGTAAGVAAVSVPVRRRARSPVASRSRYVWRP